MQRSSLSIVIVLAACTGAPAQTSPPPRPAFPAAPSFPGAASMPAASSEARAVEIADRVMQALGGREAWDKTRFLRFGFGSERDGKFQGRTHVWDKWTGRYRVEGINREGAPFVTLMNLNTRQGEAWMSGQRLGGDALKAELERAYGMWVNDTYWLLMPYKLRDPGVTLAYAGEESANGATYDKVKLAFDNVGLTPKDNYWVWVNRDTGLVDRWDYVLAGEAVPPTTWSWTGWRKHGNIMLAGERVNPEGRKILLPDIAVLESVPDSVFTSPDPMR